MIINWPKKFLSWTNTLAYFGFDVSEEKSFKNWRQVNFQFRNDSDKEVAISKGQVNMVVTSAATLW